MEEIESFTAINGEELYAGLKRLGLKEDEIIRVDYGLFIKRTDLKKYLSITKNNK